MTDDTERRLANLAAYHVAMFTRMAGSERTPAEVAHGLFLLIEEAKRCRERWLYSQQTVGFTD